MTAATPETPTPRPPAAAPSFDVHLAARILVQLNIVRKNTTIYADGHPALQASAGRALRLLEEFLARADVFSLSITRDSLRLGEHEFPQRNPIVAEFVTYLHDQSIYLFNLKRGLTEEDLLQVNRLLAGGGKVLPPELSLPEAVAQFSHGHAEVQVVDWSRSEFTDEATIDLMDQGRTGSGETSWDSFVRQLLQQAAESLLLETEAGSPGAEATEGDDPASRTEESAAATDHHAATEYLRSLRAGKGGTWLRVRRIVSFLEPDLQPERLLALKPPAAIRDIEHQDAQLVLEALEQASSRGLPLHPKVLRLVEALAATGDKGWPIPPLDRPALIREFVERIHSFLTTEGFTASPAGAKAGEALGTLQEELSQQLATAARLRGPTPAVADVSHYAQTLLDLLEAATDSRAAEAPARGLADLVLASALAADWEAVSLAWRGLDELEARAGAPQVRDWCQKAKAQLGDAPRLSQLGDAALTSGLDQPELLAAILRVAGAPQAQRLVEALAKEPREAIRRALISQVVVLKEHTLPHVLRGLGDPAGSVICRMLLVLQQLGEQVPLKQIQGLAAHPEPEVRLEALRTLVVLRDPQAPLLLKGAMKDADERLSLGAIALARQAPHPEIIRALLELVMDAGWFKVSFDLPRKVAAVRSLIAMGDPAVFPELHRLVAQRPFAHLKDSRRLRIEVFRSLATADVAELADFLRLGQRFRDPEIVASCRTIERRLQAPDSPSKPRGSAGGASR